MPGILALATLQYRGSDTYIYMHRGSLLSNEKHVMSNKKTQSYTVRRTLGQNKQASDKGGELPLLNRIQ